MENLIGKELNEAIFLADKSGITELRIRKGRPLQMEVNGEICDCVNALGKRIVIDGEDIKKIVLNFCDGSFFSRESEVNEGFLSKYGARLGISGACDYQTGVIKSIEEITSLALRLPFKGEITPTKEASLIGKNLLSTLVISPFGAGKTTFLKQLLLAFPKNKKVFLCDERGEFSGEFSMLDNVDAISFAKKNKAFEIAIRLFSPNAIVIDEMFYSLDAKLLQKARMAGVAIFASFHGRSEVDYIGSEVYEKGIFSRYVILSETKGKGTVEYVLDENFQKLQIYSGDC